MTRKQAIKETNKALDNGNYPSSACVKAGLLSMDQWLRGYQVYEKVSADKKAQFIEFFKKKMLTIG